MPPTDNTAVPLYVVLTNGHTCVFPLLGTEPIPLSKVVLVTSPLWDHRSVVQFPVIILELSKLNAILGNWYTFKLVEELPQPPVLHAVTL